MRILIIKLTSIGDIIQTYRAFNQIRQSYPGAKISWAVEEKFQSCVSHLRGLDEVIAFPFKEIKKGVYRPIIDALKRFRKRSFDIVFDFQGNLKSSVLLSLISAETKVGFDKQGVAEWPNLLFTNHKVYAPRDLYSEERNLRIVDSVTKAKRVPFHPIKFLLAKEEKKEVEAFLESISKTPIMLCPFSSWDQKSLSIKAFREWIRLMRQDWAFHVIIPYFHSAEQKKAEEIAQEFSHVHLWKIVSIPHWQYLMEHMKMVIAVDSASLHLAGVTNIPTFSVFGPTLKKVYGPIGEIHKSYQSGCPLNQSFNIKCKKMRKCSAPCMKELDFSEVYRVFLTHLLDIVEKQNDPISFEFLTREKGELRLVNDKKVEPFLV